MIEGYEQIFYLHIPKTGGTSVGHALREAGFDVRWMSFGRTFRKADRDEVSRFARTLLDADVGDVLQGHLPYPIAGVLKQPLLIMAFLRHPLDRAMSTVEYQRRVQKQQFAETGWRRRVRTIAERSREGTNRQTKLLGAEFDPVPLLARLARGELAPGEARRQFHFLMGTPDRATLERAKARLEMMQFVGITEAMDESIRLLRKTFMPSFPNVERANAAPAADRAARSRRYDQTALDAVTEANSLDRELHEFAVGLFRKRYEEAFGEPISGQGLEAISQ